MLKTYIWVSALAAFVAIGLVADGILLGTLSILAFCLSGCRLAATMDDGVKQLFLWTWCGGGAALGLCIAGLWTHVTGIWIIPIAVSGAVLLWDQK